MSTRHRLLQILSIIVILSMAFSGFSVPTASAQAQGGDGIKRQVNAQTGKVSFIRPEIGRVLSATRALGISPFARPADPGLALAKRFGPEFGLKDPARDLTEMKTNRSANGRMFIRYQQNYQGIPVMGGELIVNTNEKGDLYSINGEISPDISLSTEPTVDPEQARQAALEGAAKWYQQAPGDFVASDPELWIFDESLLQSSTRPVELVWRMEVTSKETGMPVRELVLVNAQRGTISLHFNQVDTAWGWFAKEKTASVLNTTQENIEPSNGVTTTDSTTHPMPALAGVNWYVATTGSDTNSCTTPASPCANIQKAINLAASNDIINVADGTYYYPGSALNPTPNVVVLNNKGVVLSGGWQEDFSSQTGVSIIDGENTNNGILAITTGTSFVDRFVIQNSRSSNSGGIYLANGNFTLKNSTLRDNVATSKGAGIFLTSSATLTLINNTISGNTAGGSGGGIYVDSGTVNVQYSTIAHNTSTAGTGGGVFQNTGTLNVYNSIVANNNGSTSPNCNSLSASDYNVIGSITGCTFTAGTQDQIDVSDPGINNALTGTMPVHELLTGSPAIDAGDLASCNTNAGNRDQRGMLRPLGVGCDIGAYEFVVPSIVSFSGSNQFTLISTAFSSPLVAYVVDGLGDPVSGVTVTFTAPASGASGTFANGGLTTTAVTDSNGFASSSIFTANSELGEYNVGATAAGYSPAAFNLVNASPAFYVSASSGSDSNSCTSPAVPCATIQAAVNKAAAGDTIKVAEGDYPVFSNYKSLVISGGWNTSFISQVGYSIIDGQASERGLYIYKGPNPTGPTVVLDRISILNTKNNYDGGGITVGDSTLTVSNSFILHNQASRGGAVYSSNSTVNLNNVTVAQNTAGRGGGIAVNGGTVNINNSTIMYNTGGVQGGGIYSYAMDTTNVRNTIIANNTAPTGPDCYRNDPYGGIKTLDHSLVGNTTNCSLPSGMENFLNTTPGTPIFIQDSYYAFLDPSPIVDAGDPNTCEAGDQRGRSRQGSVCDMGAFERGSSTNPINWFGISRGNNQGVVPGDLMPVPLAVYALDSNGDGVSGLTVTFTAPASGASGTFDDNGTPTQTVTVTSDANGIATAPPFTANTVVGSYQVVASAGGGWSANFEVRNIIWYVATTGSDTNDCQTPATPCATLNGVVDKAEFMAGDVVRVAEGIYSGSGSQVVLLNKDVHLLGGWNTAFTARTGWSILDGQGARTVMVVGDLTSVTAEQFVIRNGSSSSGAGIANNGMLTLSNSAVTGNIASDYGGGIFSGTSGTLILNNSTVSGNRANHGGGLYSYRTATLNNTTISGNFAAGYGGGINYYGMAGSAFTIQNTLIAGNLTWTSGPDCYGNIGSAGYNLIGNDTLCNFSATTGDLVGTSGSPIDPRLIPLPQNSESIFTHALMPDSPAINAGNPAIPGSGGSACVAIDLRGVGRPQGTRCDIGAFEYLGSGTTPAYIVALSGTPQYLLRGTAAPSVLKAVLLDDAGNVVPGRTVTFTAPASGASVVFAGGGNSSTAVADANGIATSPAFSANSIAGDYTIQATVTGLAGSADFQMTNGSEVKTYTANNNRSTTLPGTFVCDQGSLNCTNGSDPHADSAQLHSMGTYSLYMNMHGRNGIDNNNMTIKSTVAYCPSSTYYPCPYPNASWIGTQVVYGNAYGYPLADDVVAHELTHGVTQYESNLFYYYQSGAINESFSDLWGEYYDQSNGLGTDTYGAKWLIGEDVLNLGAMRSMSNPSANPYRDPDRMTSSYYHKTEDDEGGVHHNSGINNKAVFLMVEGGDHNGKTVTALGWEKTAAIYYEANTNLLISGADYSDLYYVLQQACTNLIGQKGITSGDCGEVKDAIDAVEMNLQPVSGFNTHAPYCDAGNPVATVLSDNLESGTGNWTFANGAYPRWQYDSPYGPYAHSGSHFLYADDYPDTVTDATARLVSVTVPNHAYLHFAHAYGFETYDIYNFDGGVLEYSINGGSAWLDAGSLIDNDNGYKRVIYTGYGNPLSGRSAFVGSSHGYIDTRLNLASLAGKSVIFRWRMGLDEGTALWGWWVDDVKIYRCPIDIVPPAAITGLAATTGTTVATVRLNWKAVGDDGTAGTATSYLVRYSSSPIADDATWNAATPVTTGIPTPAVAGSDESMTVSGLVPGQTYYFAVRAQDEEPNLGGLSNSPAAVAKSPTPQGVGIYDDTDPNWTYTGSWSQATTTGPYNGTDKYTNNGIATASFTFSGIGFTLKYVKASNRGNIEVWVDGTKVDTINAYSTALTWQAPYTKSGLTNDVHTVVFKHGGPSGSFIDIDAIQIFAAAPAGIYDDTDPAWTYTGSWTPATTTGPYNGTDKYTNNMASTASFTFIGTGFIFKYVTASNRGNIQVWVDGVQVDTINAYSSALTWQVTYTKSGLANSVHTVVFKHGGPGGYFIDIDSIQVAEPDPLPPGDVTGLSATPGTANGSVNLSWTAPADDAGNDASGPVTSYLVKYSTSPFTGWDQGTLVTSGLPTPVTPGSTQTMTVSGLSSDTLYYFAVRAQDEFPNLSASYATASATTDPFTPPGAGTYDDMDPNWTYTGSWSQATTTGPYNGTDKYTNNGIATASFTFSGIGFTLKYVKASNRGNIEVWVDGTKVDTINAYSTALTWQAPYTKSGLTNDVHTVVFKHGGPSGSFIDIDAIQIFAAAPAGIYDDTDPAWTYTGSWTPATTTGPYNGTDKYTNNMASTASFTFIGTGFIFKYVTASNRGNIQVWVDGVQVDTINAYSSALTWQVTYTKSGLANSVHTVVFKHGGPGGYFIDIDSIQIFP